jgi:excisionase family DNA binding protein
LTAPTARAACAPKLGGDGPSILSLFQFADLRDTARMETTDFTNPVTFDEAFETATTHHQKLTYSVAEAASLLGVSRPSIYRLIARRVLIPIPGLRHKRLPKKQVRRLGQGENCAGIF